MQIPTRSTASIALLPLLLAPALRAQQTKIVPAGNTSVEGSTLSVYPFGYTNPRCQQIWDGSTITSSTGLISSISYRSDGRRTGALPARAYTNVKFDLGVTTKTPSTLSTTFANNITSPMTTVLSGAYNLPSQMSPIPGTQPFNIAFSWTTPFIYNAKNGDLLLDITLPGSIGKSSYFVDAEYSGANTGGSAAPYGKSGSFSNPEVFNLSADAKALTPGGSLSTTCGPFTQSYAGTLVLGVSDRVWSGNPLPLDLGVIGATGNNLYVSLDARLPFNTVLSGRSYVSSFKTAIPNSPIYNGLSFYAQAYYTDAKANPAGLVTTHGLALKTAGGGRTVETNQVGSFDSTKAVGNFAFGATRPGGPVTRFFGVLP